jgi:sugar phosphate isomerase/epimerase
MTQPIAIQSWCYRNFRAVPAFIEQLRNTGVNATELCGVQVDFNQPDTWPAALEQFRKAGVQIVAIGVQFLVGDPARDRNSFEFCRQAGVKFMSVSFPPEAMFDGLRNIEKLADEYDVQLGIHNHGGYDWLGNGTILKYVFGKTSKRIGLHMVGIHVKDFTYDPKREPKDVIIGTGNLDLPALMKVLKQSNFSGPMVIEYEGDEQNPVPALKACVAELKKLM